MSEAQLDKLKYEEFVFRSEMIEHEKAEEYKDKMVAATFMAWQMGAGSGKSFSDYIRSMGLLENEPELTEEQKDNMARFAIEKAERIKALDKKRVIK